MTSAPHVRAVRFCWRRSAPSVSKRALMFFGESPAAWWWTAAIVRRCSSMASRCPCCSVERVKRSASSAGPVGTGGIRAPGAGSAPPRRFSPDPGAAGGAGHGDHSAGVGDARRAIFDSGNTLWVERRFHLRNTARPVGREQWVVVSRHGAVPGTGRTDRLSIRQFILPEGFRLYTVDGELLLGKR